MEQKKEVSKFVFNSELLKYGDNKKDYGSWTTISTILNKRFGLNYSESYYRKKYKRLINKTPNNSTLNKNWELQKQEKKLQTEKIELNQWLREEARYEKILDRIETAILQLQPLAVPSKKIVNNKNNEKEAILCIADAHYGTEFEIKGLDGEILNKYSPEIFEKVMWSFFDDIVKIIEKEKLTRITLFELGDSLDGMLRVGQLFKLRYGVIQSTIQYAYFLANWLNELSKIVYIDFYMTNGNHTELRMLGQPKGTFHDENLGFVILQFLKQILKNNSNITIHDSPTEFIFTTKAGFNIMGIHGSVKNLEQAIKDYSLLYNKSIDILIGAHLHHDYSKNIGINKDIIRVPSVVGIDYYSTTLIRSANAGLRMIILEENRGRTTDYFIKKEI